jgi:hypothetical protein
MDWLTILGVVFVTGIGATVYIFNTFLTKGEGELIQKQLDRIEAKVDRLLYKEGK